MISISLLPQGPFYELDNTEIIIVKKGFYLYFEPDEPTAQILSDMTWRNALGIDALVYVKQGQSVALHEWVPESGYPLCHGTLRKKNRS